jgi:hypothetical protein
MTQIIFPANRCWTCALAISPRHHNFTETNLMKRSIVIAAVCGVSLFGSTAVAGAAGNPPNPNPAAIANVGTACTTVITTNPNVNGSVSFPGNATGIFDGGQVGSVFCGL